MPKPQTVESRRRAGRAVPVVVLLLCLAAPERGAAQATVSEELVVAGANALLGGLTSGIVRWVRGESFLEGLWGGALGGGVHYAGKRIGTAAFPGAGLAGTMVGATGASMVRNVGMGYGMLEYLTLPVGPIVLNWRTTPDSAGVSARLHVGRAIFLGRLLLNDDLRFNGAESLSAGTPVFEARDRVIEGESGREIGGVEMWGTITLSDRGLMPPLDHGRLLAHERVHVVQETLLNIAWADPIEDWLVARLPYGDVVNRYVDFGGVYMAVAGLMILVLPYEYRPWEDEAAYMESGW